MSKAFIVGGLLIFSLALVLGVYFLVRDNSVAEPVTTQSTTDLKIKQQELSKEQATLDEMLRNLNTSYPLGTSVQDQIKKGKSLVGKTNFLFAGANGPSPTLAISGFSGNFLINNERKNINLLLQGWESKTSLSYLTNIDLAEADKIKREAEVIKSYISSILDIINGLTPNNSGLTESEINSYLSELPTIESINQVIESLQNQINNATPPPPPTVTPSQVETQQGVVNQIEEEIVAIETPPPAPEPPAPEEPAPSTFTFPFLFTPRTINTKQGIIVQPGPPSLIPSTDPF